MNFDRIKKIRGYLFRKEMIRPAAIFAAGAGFVWFAIFGDSGLYQLHKSANLKNSLGRQIVEQRKEIEYLEIQKKLLNDPDHLELVIRQELGYVKPGEVVFQQMSP